MSGVSLPVTRPSGRALVVGNPASRVEPLGTLQRMGYGCTEADDPYAAMAELCRRPLAYRAIILSLASVHREELGLVPGVKRRFPHIDIWLTQTDGRQAALAEAMRLGADGLLSREGLHRVAMAPATPTYAPGETVAGPSAAAPAPVTLAPQTEEPEAPAEERATSTTPAEETDSSDEGAPVDDEPGLTEPVLTADELRALLQEQPPPPSSIGNPNES